MLRRADLDNDPLEQFQRWYAAAVVEHPEEAALATATPDGRPSVRMVLCRTVDERGIVFYTNYVSRKGRELAANPRGALLFHWPADRSSDTPNPPPADGQSLGRQVRIEGRVGRVSPEESDHYWRTRSPASRRVAAVSRQSQRLAQRSALEAEVDEIRRRHGDNPPRPGRWGGYRLVPDRYEFWQHGPDRLHDRFVYEPAGDGWRIYRVAP